VVAVSGLVDALVLGHLVLSVDETTAKAELVEEFSLRHRTIRDSKPLAVGVVCAAQSETAMVIL
jgi:hypothetical protein